jgi:hypothetical protein
MSRRNSSLVSRVIALVLLLFGVIGAVSAASTTSLQPVPREMLCVTEGTLAELPDQRLSVSVPKMRAFVRHQTRQAVEARFKYLGRTAKVVPLGSGEVREQFGLKLRAADACNLVYAMWRFKPTASLVVSVKSNPGQHTSAECGNAGYTNIEPSSSKPVIAPARDSSHTLRASLSGSALRVFVDGDVVWEGDVGPQALTFDGPVGVRSDNVRVQFKLFAPPAGDNTGVLACVHGAGD